MDARRPSGGEDGSPPPNSDTPPLRRRYSMEEDMFYQHIMTSPPRRPSQPPPYEPENSVTSSQLGGKDKDVRAADGRQNLARRFSRNTILSEYLPDYNTSIHIEGVFSKKHEIENTIKRAEDRQWHTVFVTLNGTALNVYNVKKDWGWGRSRDGPTISPDNPPWVRRSKLERSYNLLHADVGIAADYRKRRYVIRVRAETDQFLLSCVELETFVKWLELLFAAIDVAAPLDDRDFPRDMSIPRIQRIRWFRGESPGQNPYSDPVFGTTDEPIPQNELSSVPEEPRRLSQAVAPTTTTQNPSSLRHEQAPEVEVGVEATSDLGQDAEVEEQPLEDEIAIDDDDEDDESVAPFSRGDRAHRLSTTSYPNVAIDPHSGKWFPEHQWSSAHDLLYAKLCYSTLLFRSPRKSNFIINKGKQWFVDWTTGRMVRVLPPAYGEITDYFGPWQVIHTENRRI